MTISVTGVETMAESGIAARAIENSPLAIVFAPISIPAELVLCRILPIANPDKNLLSIATS